VVARDREKGGRGGTITLGEMAKNVRETGCSATEGKEEKNSVHPPKKLPGNCSNVGGTGESRRVRAAHKRTEKTDCTIICTHKRKGSCIKTTDLTVGHGKKLTTSRLLRKKSGDQAAC